MMCKREIAKNQLRSFGLIVGGGFTVIGVWPLVFHGEDPRIWALLLAAALVTAGMILPITLRWPYRVWMAVGETLGWLNTRIILSVVYYGMIVPIGTIFRVSGRDPMRRGFQRDGETYRIPSAKRPASHMQRQY